MKWLLPVAISCTAWVLSAGNWAAADLVAPAVRDSPPEPAPAAVDAAADMQSVANKFDKVLDKFNDATDKLEAAAEQFGESSPVPAEITSNTQLAPAPENIPPAPSIAETPEPEPNTRQNGFGRRAALIASLTIFALAVFVGFEVITKVPPTLHTPLMSGSNAISGITVVGALLAAGAGTPGKIGFAELLGLLAVVLAMINVVGGFMVTDRMLGMFRRK